MATIYKFTSKTSGKTYIGQTRQTAEARANAHRTGSHNPKNKSYNSKFYRAIRKYGWDDFEHEILNTCKPDELNDWECKYITEYDSYHNGYNETTGGDAPVELSAESNKRRSETHTKRFQNMNDDEKRNWSDMLKARHKAKPMTAETKKKISESLKKTWKDHGNIFHDNTGQKERIIDYIKVKQNKVSTSYIVTNHPKCKHKSFNTMVECQRYLLKLDIDILMDELQKIQEHQVRVTQSIEQIEQAIQTIINNFKSALSSETKWRSGAIAP